LASITQNGKHEGILVEQPFGQIRKRMRLPLIAAPMFLVSGVELVSAACKNGVVGAFPTANCRGTAQLEEWLTEISERLRRHEGETGEFCAPFCPNLIVHRSNPRLYDDLDVIMRHKAKLVITSVGSPAPVLEPLHQCGALVFADVATIRHAQRALAVGADGLVLLTAGAGGQTGWLNPFSFARAVRTFFKGPLVLAGGISDGQALRAAEVLGCDLAYMGTKFIATVESMADPKYKQMLVDSTADDIVLTRAFTGLQTNMLRPSIVAAGLDPDALPERDPINIAKDIDVIAREREPKRWRDIWSAGHSTSGVDKITTVADLIAQISLEYHGACAV